MEQSPLDAARTEMCNAIQDIMERNSCEVNPFEITEASIPAPGLPPKFSLLSDQVCGGRQLGTGQPTYEKRPEAEDEPAWRRLCLQRWPNIDQHLGRDPLLQQPGKNSPSWLQCFLQLDAAEPLWALRGGFRASYSKPHVEGEPTSSTCLRRLLRMTVHDRLVPIGVTPRHAFVGIRRKGGNSLQLAYMKLDLETGLSRERGSMGIPGALWRLCSTRLQDALWAQLGGEDVIAAVHASFSKQLLPAQNMDPAAGGTRFQLSMQHVLASGEGQRLLLPAMDAEGTPAMLACSPHYLVVNYVSSSAGRRGGLWVYHLDSSSWLQLTQGTVSGLNLQADSLAYGEGVQLHILKLDPLFASGGEPDPGNMTMHVPVWEPDLPSSRFRSPSHEPILVIYQEEGRLLLSSAHNTCLLSYLAPTPTSLFRQIGRDAGPNVGLHLYAGRAVFQKSTGVITIHEAESLKPVGRWDDSRILQSLLSPEELELRKRKGEPAVSIRIQDCYACIAQSSSRIFSLLPNGIVVCLSLPALER